jgi:hypothetical protein
VTVDATQVRAMLDGWREQRADRLDPVRFHRLDALAKRAAALDGDARALLDARLATLLDAFAAIVARASEGINVAATATAAACDSAHAGAQGLRAAHSPGSSRGSRAMRRPTGAGSIPR